jgi:hypothetical protein
MQHKIVHYFGLVVRRTLSVVARTLMTCLIFVTCAVIAMHLFGIPVPIPDELLDKFEGLARLAKKLA